MALSIGEQSVEFQLPGVDGNNYSLADYSNKSAVVVIFSCNHCPYVQAWEERIIQIQKDFESNGVQLLVISANDAEQYPDDGFPAMKERAKAKGFNFPYLFDESQEIAKAYGAERTPEVFVFDSNQTLQYHGTIDDNYENPEAVTKTYLRDAIDAIAEGNKPAVNQTDPVGCTIKWK
tara:strand:+ start:4190 stop:4720 length:531 start_codon:yes stop_codon:yes gene_type:complete